jgi:hypothetical protein
MTRNLRASKTGFGLRRNKQSSGRRWKKHCVTLPIDIYKAAAHTNIMRRETLKQQPRGTAADCSSTPLIREIREDQKREVRELVRMIGLGTVASHI